MEASSSNEQNEDYLYIVKFSRSNSLLNNEQESDNESIDKIQTEKSTRDESNRSRASRGCSHGRGRDRDRGYGRNNQNTIELPPPPSFNIFWYDKPLHEFTINSFRKYQFHLLSPYSIFCLFFSLEQIKIIVQNTNLYTYLKNAGRGRKWKDLTIGEFKIWLVILIYAGIFKLPSIKDYWNKDDKFSEHKITIFIILLQFEHVLLI